MSGIAWFSGFDLARLPRLLPTCAPAVRSPMMAGVYARVHALFTGGAADGSQQVAAGIALMVISTLGFSASHTMIRIATADMHPFQVTFFRNLFGMLVLSYWFARHGLETLRTRRLPLHLLRVTFSALSLLTFYYALSITPLAKVTALGFITPIFLIVLAAVFLRERFGAARAGAVALGVLGALVVVRPGAVEVDFGTTVMLVSALLFAGALFCMKVLTRSERPVTMTSYAIVLLTPITLVPALGVWRWPEPAEWPLLVAIGVISVGSVLIFTSALKFAPTHVVMPFDYLRLIWMSLLGYLLFAEVPDLFTWLGGSLIFASAMFVTVSEYRAGRRRQDAVPAAGAGPAGET